MLIKWTLRRFNFEYPVELFPAILERVRGTPARIREMIEGKSDAVLSYRPESAWSIKEHIGHLNDLEELHEGRIDDFLEGTKTLRAADMENSKTKEAGHNEKSIEELLSDFRFSRNIFIERLNSIEPEFWSQSALHPRLNKNMRVVDMVYFVAEHDDHHLAIMRQILKVVPGNVRPRK